MRTQIWLSLLCGVVLFTAPARAALPVPSLEKLPNGLTIAWFLNDNLPVVDLAVLANAGWSNDLPGKSGTAELIAATLDHGFAREVERLGASRYATPDEDTFTVGMHGLAPDAPVLLDLLAKLTVKPEFSESVIDKEKRRLIDQWRHLQDFSDALAMMAFGRVLSQDTPYGRGSIFSSAELSRLTRADALAFHRANFTPKNSVLMIVGRVNRAEFKPLVEKAFGAWSGEVPLSPKKAPVFSDAQVKIEPGQILLVDRPGLTQAQIRMGFRIPLMGSPDHYALTVGNSLLGEYFQSRLNSVIRDQLGLSYGVTSSLAYSKGLARLMISTSTRNEAVGELLKNALGAVTRLQKDGAPDEEVRMAREYLLGGFPLSVSTLSGVASRWLHGYVFGMGTEYLNEFAPKVGAVTRAQVNEAASKYLDAAKLLIVIAGDAKEIEKSLKASGYTRIKRVKAQALL